MENSHNWVILPPGDRCLLRFGASTIPSGCEQAHVRDLVTANFGAPFPWGWLPEPSATDQLWHQHRIGTGGLFHKTWFVCKEGRVGGADNVPATLPGSLRSCLYLDGGLGHDGVADNEGLAIIRSTSPSDTEMYRRVMLHAARHIMADHGHLIVTPIGPDNTVKVGFGGRCRSCPNPLLITIQQLRVAVPQYRFEPLPEWLE